MQLWIISQCKILSNYLCWCAGTGTHWRISYHWLSLQHLWLVSTLHSTCLKLSSGPTHDRQCLRTHHRWKRKRTRAKRKLRRQYWARQQDRRRRKPKRRRMKRWKWWVDGCVCVLCSCMNQSTLFHGWMSQKVMKAAFCRFMFVLVVASFYVFVYFRCVCVCVWFCFFIFCSQYQCNQDWKVTSLKYLTYITWDVMPYILDLLTHVLLLSMYHNTLSGCEPLWKNGQKWWKSFFDPDRVVGTGWSLKLKLNCTNYKNIFQCWKVKKLL